MCRWKWRFSANVAWREHYPAPAARALRRQGLRLVQVWLPDVRSRRFAVEARRESLLVSRQHSERDIVEHIERAADLAGWKAWKAMREFESLCDEGPRVVQAPEPALTPSTVLPPNRVMSVTLEPEEDVAWIWTSTPDGGSYVSGYTITKRK